MKRLRFLITAMLLIVNLSYADDEAHRFPMDLHDLSLTSQQHKAVESAMREYQHAYRTYHDQSEKTRQELNLLFVQPTFDEKSFYTKNMEMERTSIEIRTRLFSRLHTILTPDQKRRFIRHIQEWDVE